MTQLNSINKTPNTAAERVWRVSFCSDEIIICVLYTTSGEAFWAALYTQRDSFLIGHIDTVGYLHVNYKVFVRNTLNTN